MMSSPGSFVAQYKNASIDELMLVRADLMLEIADARRALSDNEHPANFMEPSPLSHYEMAFDYICMLDKLIKKRCGSFNASHEAVVKSLTLLRLDYSTCGDSTRIDSRIESWECYLVASNVKSFVCSHTLHGRYPDYMDSVFKGKINRHAIINAMLEFGVDEWGGMRDDSVCDGVCWSLDVIGEKGSFRCDGLNAFPQTYDAFTTFISNACIREA